MLWKWQNFFIFAGGGFWSRMEFFLFSWGEDFKNSPWSRTLFGDLEVVWIFFYFWPGMPAGGQIFFFAGGHGHITWSRTVFADLEVVWIFFISGRGGRTDFFISAGGGIWSRMDFFYFPRERTSKKKSVKSHRFLESWELSWGVRAPFFGAAGAEKGARRAPFHTENTQNPNLKKN